LDLRRKFRKEKVSQGHCLVVIKKKEESTGKKKKKDTTPHEKSGEKKRLGNEKKQSGWFPGAGENRHLLQRSDRGRGLWNKKIHVRSAKTVLCKARRNVGGVRQGDERASRCSETNGKRDGEAPRRHVFMSGEGSDPVRGTGEKRGGNPEGEKKKCDRKGIMREKHSSFREKTGSNSENLRSVGGLLRPCVCLKKKKWGRVRKKEREKRPKGKRLTGLVIKRKN